MAQDNPILEQRETGKRLDSCGGGLVAFFIARLGSRDVLFLAAILILGLALRLHHINRPPVDFECFRETQTLMVARNFYREGMNLFSPSVDWRSFEGLAPRGTVAMTELQVTPYLTALLYFIFGIQYWVGRVVPIVFSLIGAGYFYLLVRRFNGRACAFLAGVLYTVSPHVLFCGRVQMPEPFAFAMFFAALYYYDRWLSDDKNNYFWSAVIFCVLTLLGKPQFGIIIFPLCFLTFARFGMRTFRQPRLYLFAALVGIPVSAFIGYSFVVLKSSTGVTFGVPELFDYRRYLADPGYYLKIAYRVWILAVTPPVCLLGAVGFFVPAKKRKDFFAHAWLGGAVAFFFLMPGGNFFNGYYQMVLAPPVIVLASRALALGLTRRWLRIGVVGAMLLCAGYSLKLMPMLYAENYLSDYHCGTWLKENTPTDTLVFTSNGNPATLYFADRVGWKTLGEWFGKDGPRSCELVNKATALGATVLAVPDSWFDNAYYPQYQQIRDLLYDTYCCYHGPDFTIFLLRIPADLSVPVEGRVTFDILESRKYLRGTWGPQQQDSSGKGFVTMGPAKRSAIVFTSSALPQRIRLGVASAVDNQVVSVQLNNKETRRLNMPIAFQENRVEIDCSGAIAFDGHWRITLEAAQQNEIAASLILFSMKIETDP